MCDLEPSNTCQFVTKLVPKLKPSEECVDVPKEMCDLEPRNTCQFVTKLVPKLEPSEECVDVPKEICARARGSPVKVQRPTIKRWCYVASKESGLE